MRRPPPDSTAAGADETANGIAAAFARALESLDDLRHVDFRSGPGNGETVDVGIEQPAAPTTHRARTPSPQRRLRWFLFRNRARLLWVPITLACGLVVGWLGSWLVAVFAR